MAEVKQEEVPRLGWTCEEVGAQFRVPARQVEDAVRRGELDHIRIGRHIRITDSAIRRWMETLRVAA